MTLGEFREYTKNMRDDVNIAYHHSGAYIPINTFGIADDDNTLVMVNTNYEENHIMGIVTAMAVFDKRKRNEE